MDKKSKVASNKKQLGRLVQLMQDNQDLAKGICGKTRAKPRWEAIAVELNSLGPPLRAWEKWLNVWTDLKSKTKKKISENRAEFRATGGGPNSLHILTPLEEGVASFLRYDICSDPPGQEIGHNAIVQSEEIPVEQVACGSDYITISGEDCEMRETQETEISEVHLTPRRRKVANSTANDRRIALLETQVNNQAKHFEAMEESANNIKKSLKYIESYIRKSYNLQKENLAIEKEKLELKKQKLMLLKEEVANKNRHRTEKLKLKVQLLQLQKENVSSLIL